MPRDAASASIGLSGWTKCETSAMSAGGEWHAHELSGRFSLLKGRDEKEASLCGREGRVTRGGETAEGSMEGNGADTARRRGQSVRDTEAGTHEHQLGYFH